MGLGLYKKKNFKILLISGILIILGVFVISGYSQISKWWEINSMSVKAGINDNVRGWAWGENMGWISMNCYNDFNYDHAFENCCSGGLDCPEELRGAGGIWQNNYGVTYVDTSSGNYINEALMGYAWSDKVGWICFGKSCKCADCTSCDDYDTCTNCSGCPSNTKPPHGWPFPWACIGKPTWTCNGGSNNGDSCSIDSTDCPDGYCIFSCSGDGAEDFLDISVQGAPCYSVTGDKLKAHWMMNTVSVIDNSNNTNNGTLMPVDDPPSLANGKFENALQFDGINDYIDISDSTSLSITGNLTIEAWIKRGSIGDEQTILGKWDESKPTDDKKSYRLWFDVNNKLNFSVANNTDIVATVRQTQGLCFGGAEGGASTPCSTDTDCYDPLVSGTFCRNSLITDTTKWHHISGKYIAAVGTNVAVLQLFVDGARVNVDSIGTPPVILSDKNNDLYIGAKKGTSVMDTYFNGIIDNIAIWSCTNIGFVTGRSAKDIWTDAKMEISGWAKVVALGDGGWLKLQGLTKEGKVWGLYLDDYDTFYTVGGYMANRYADTTMDTTGLIANWLMDEPGWTNSAGPINDGVVDSSPLNNHGIAYGAIPSTEGIFNSAGEFDGVDDYIEIFDNASLNFNASDDITIQYWVKPNSFSTNGSTPVVKRESGAGYEVQIDANGGVSWYLSDGTYTKADTDNSGILILNTWNHVAVVFDRENNEITRYLNGVVTGSVDNFGNVGDLSNNLSLSIGGRFLRADAYFNGLIDNVSIYNFTRTETQILADYNKQNPYCVGWDDYGHQYGSPPEPLAFDNLSVDNTQGCSQLIVQWDASDWAENYTYWRCVDIDESDCSTCSYIEHNVLDAEEFNVQDTDVVTNTGYCYKIQAHNETGSTYNSDGPTWRRTTLCSPENLQIDDEICGEIKVYWDLLANADGYNIYNSLSNENFEIIGHLGEGIDYTGLKAQWKMNESNWNGISGEVKDSSGEFPANNGTAENLLSTTSSGKFNYAGNFDGVSDYINCGSNESLEAPTATIQAWIKRSSTDTSDVIIADNKTSPTAKDHYLWLEIGTNDKLAIFFGDGTNQATKYSIATIDDTDWHHIAVVRDDADGIGMVTFYIDGKAESAQSYSLSGVIVPLGEDDLWVGKSNGIDSFNPFYGLIDNLAIYNVARTAEQIKFDYEAGNCGSDNCALSNVCHIEGVDDNNCGKIQSDTSVCCYTDRRILPYINYYYRTTATSEAGESPFSDCGWTSDNCPAISGDPCCPNGKTICFPPVETEEE